MQHADIDQRTIWQFQIGSFHRDPDHTLGRDRQEQIFGMSVSTRLCIGQHLGTPLPAARGKPQASHGDQCRVALWNVDGELATGTGTGVPQGSRSRQVAEGDGRTGHGQAGRDIDDLASESHARAVDHQRWADIGVGR